MVPTERPIRQVERIDTERMGNIFYIDRFRPTVKVSHINEIDYAGFKQKGVNTLLLDAEGTMVHHNGWDIDPAIVESIKSQAFDNIAIITNKKPKNEKEFIRLNHWAEQLGSDAVVFSQMDPSERKPSSRMLLKAAVHFGIRPDQALVIGDKLTADILAANRAGMWSVKVDRLGWEDLPADRMARRPMEWAINQRVGRDANSNLYLYPPESEAGKILNGMLDQKNHKPSKVKPEWFVNGDIPDKLWDKSRIIGYGLPDAVLPQEVSDAIPPGWSDAPGIKDIKDVLKLADQKIADNFDDLFGDYLYENGRKVADNLTRIRRHGSWVVAGLILLDMPKTAAALHAVLTLTDFLDGIAARKDKNGPTDDGAREDQEADKKASRREEAAQVIAGRLGINHFILREGSNWLMNGVVRPKYKLSGHDVKATTSGKGATFSVNVAELVAILTKDSEWAELVQEVATVAKVSRIPLSQRAWKLKKADNDRYEEVRAQMLQAA